MTITASRIKIKDSTTYRSLLDIFYPVDSVYISTVNTNPASFLGGTWVAISREDAVLRASNTYGLTGSDTHTLTTKEMPAHSHQEDNFVVVVAKNGTRIQQDGLVIEGKSKRNHNIVANYSNYVTNNEWKVTQYTGGGASHSIVQRSINCFVWRRTA